MESKVKNKIYTKHDRITWIELNRNGAAVEGIVYALTQIRAKDSEIYIHINNVYICGYSGKLQEWKKTGYRNRKGSPIRYRNHWKRISEMLEERKNTIYFLRDIPEAKKEELIKIGSVLKSA
jgi:ribonuclease HI